MIMKNRIAKIILFNKILLNSINGNKKLYNKVFSCFFCTLMLSGQIYAQQGGIITTSRGNGMGIISYAAGVTSAGISTGRHIDGYVKKLGVNSFIYPVGDGGFYRPFAAASNNITGAYFFENPAAASAEIIGGPFPISSKDPDVGSVSEIEFWDINGTFSSKISLTWNATSNIGLLIGSEDLSKLLIVGWDGSKWVKIESAVDATSILGGASTISAGSITTNASIAPDSYKIYSLAAVPGGALPVTLVNFEVNKNEKSVQLDWSTSAEINSDYFDIQRSSTGKSWTNIGRVETKGSLENAALEDYVFIDNEPLPGENLYRLKMVDTDGSFAYSQIRAVIFHFDNKISIYPNPVSDKLFIASNESNKITEVSLLNLYGESMICQKYIPLNGIDTKSLASGIYILTIKRDDGMISSHKIIVNR